MGGVVDTLRRRWRAGLPGLAVALLGLALARDGPVAVWPDDERYPLHWSARERAAADQCLARGSVWTLGVREVATGSGTVRYDFSGCVPQLVEDDTPR